MTTQVYKHYDIICIGSGGGNKISVPASKAGFKVAVVESGFDCIEDGQTVHKPGIGGTCLNRGCIPSKMLIHPADVANTIKHAHRFKIHVPGPITVDWRALVTRVNGDVDKDSASIIPRWEANPNLDYYPVRGSFVGNKMLQVGDKVISGDRIFIATGSRPQIPTDVPGLLDTPFLDSTNALRLREKPASLIVLGGGYIACELAHFYGALGVDVTLVVRSQMIRHEDGEVAAEFTRLFTKEYRTLLETATKSVSYSEGKFKVTVSKDGQDSVLEAEQLLVATGVVPNSDTLNLEATGVRTKKGGFIDVDGCLRTGVPGIWAMGDVIGNYLFRHCVNWEGQYLYEHIIMGNKQEYPAIDYTGMPHAVFSCPQVAGVGETEEELVARGANFIKGVNAYEDSAMGGALRSQGGFAKILIEKGTRRILGCHIVGEEASNMVHTVIPLFRLNGRLDDALVTFYIHPAINEILRNACRKARDALMAAGEELPVALQLA